MSAQRQKSKYATKRDSGKQMYGPGCCGHKLTLQQLDRYRAEVREARHYMWTPGNNFDWQDRAKRREQQG